MIFPAPEQMAPPVPFSAGILAGGWSQRFGQDKAVYMMEGETLLQRQFRLLEQMAPQELFISCRREQNLPPVQNAVFIYDENGNKGPLEGLRRMLTVCQTAFLLVCAVDLVELTSDFLRKLLGQMAPGGQGVVPWNGQYYEPLCAVYPVDILPVVNKALAENRLSLQLLIAEGMRSNLLRPYLLEPAEKQFLTNLNEKPAD